MSYEAYFIGTSDNNETFAVGKINGEKNDEVSRAR